MVAKSTYSGYISYIYSLFLSRMSGALPGKGHCAMTPELMNMAMLVRSVILKIKKFSLSHNTDSE